MYVLGIGTYATGDARYLVLDLRAASMNVHWRSDCDTHRNSVLRTMV